jgi:hypothetical protein
MLSEGLCTGFDNVGVKYLNINSDTPMSKRPLLIDQFKESTNGRVLIISYGCCAVGLDNLTFIDECYCVERVYDATLVSQSKARFHRIGQLNPVKIIFLDLPHSTDTMLLANFNRKNKSNNFLLHFDSNQENKVDDDQKVSQKRKIANTPLSIRKIASTKKPKLESLQVDDYGHLSNMVVPIP